MTEKTVPVKAILALVQYLEVDERKHFEKMQCTGVTPQTKIGSISRRGVLTLQNESDSD